MTIDLYDDTRWEGGEGGSVVLGAASAARCARACTCTGRHDPATRWSFELVNACGLGRVCEAYEVNFGDGCGDAGVGYGDVT